MSIPIGMNYTATMMGSTVKEVLCEQCGAEYLYQMQRSSEGAGTSLLFVDNDGAQERARERAAASLRSKLEKGCDVVPCPSCGHVQQHMFKKARKAYGYWMYVTGLLLFIPAFISLIAAIAVEVRADRDPSLRGVAKGILIGGGACLASGLGLLITKGVRSRGYDPNSTDLAARKQFAQTRTILKAELERMMREREQGQAPGP
jgi:predicted RNA-binding Zn-ribbon protein involved in translation (DUF1610 family)